MIDENLPTFYLKPSQQQKHLWTVFLCHHGNEPYPAYTLRYPDPESPSTDKNRYAIALCDPYVPDIIYGEILITPEWTQPSLSADAIRQNGGVTPPPEPILPSKFTVHLYNPDQEIVVRYKPKTWNSAAAWDFEMPQHTFRQPSSSTLDRTQMDPSRADVTPKLRFGWRRDSKLSKDLVCLLFGKTAMIPDTTNGKPAKNKNSGMKEPDITISIFKGLREMTLYEPNLYRVEMEDFKGLEVVLFLGAVTIRDVWFGGMKDPFRVDHAALKSNNKHAKKPVPAAATAAAVGTGAGAGAGALVPANAVPRPAPSGSQPPTATGAVNATHPQNRPPGPGQRPNAAQAGPVGPGPGQPSQPQSEPHGRRHKKPSSSEEKARRKKQEEVEKETKRLQKIYGKEEEQARRQQRPQSHPQWQNQQRPVQRPVQQPHPHAHYPHSFPQGTAPNRPAQRPPQQPSRPNLPPRRPAAPAASTPYLVPGPGPYGYGPAPGYAPGHNRYSSMQFLPQQSPRPKPQGSGNGKLQPKKSSFFGFVRRSSDDKEKLQRKRSSVF